MARRDLTQTQAALVLGISTQAMSKKARGVTRFRVDELQALAAWLDVPVSVLMDEPGAPVRVEAPPGPRHAPAQAVPA